jgi:small GTP-binding protein
MNPLLDDQARTILQQESQLLDRLIDLLDATDAPAEAVKNLEEMRAHLSDLFLVVVVGEFNAGKSTVLNALFGEVVMEEGPVPTTAKITLLRYGDTPTTRQQSEYLTERRLSADLLQHLTLVDTPGTNSIVQEHQRITEDFVPRSDLVLFVTSYDRPLTESERRFLSYIREDWGRRLVFVVNKADLAESDADLQQVIDYVQTGCREELGFEPDVFPVSARLAYRAKTSATDDADALWAKSRFAPLERFLTETLAGPEQVAIKLMGPLETAERLIEQAGVRLDERQDVLEQDQETMSRLQELLQDARAELTDGYASHVAAIEKTFDDMRRRGVQFLDDTVRVRRINLLRNQEAFRARFEERVLQDTTREIERVVTDAVDAMMSRTAQLQQRLFRTFADRVRETRRAASFAADQGFAYDRREVFEGIMQTAEREIRTHDLQQEVRRIVENVYSDANVLVGAGVGAAALGGMGIVLLVTSTLDALGGLGLATGAASALYGATVLPRQRRKAIDEFTSRVDDLQGQIQSTLQERLDKEIEAALDRVWTTVQPFAEFVDKEQSALQRAQTLQAEIEDETARLRRAVQDEIGLPDTNN